MSAGTETALAPGAACTETLELTDGEELRAVVDGLGCGQPWLARHRAFRIQQVLGIGPKPQTDKRTGIGNCLALPALGGLKPSQGVLGRAVPDS